VRRFVPLIIVAVLVISSGVATGVSLAQSRERPSSIGMYKSCSNKVGSQPTTFILSCADANSMVGSLHWVDWGDATAYATGLAKWNDCTPSCVNGHWKQKPVTVWAWRLRNGLYTRLASDDPQLLSSITLTPYPA